jgi:hypothetical protein
MPLTVSGANGQYVVGGVTRDPGITSPLGRVYFSAGPHLLGFDDSFAEPVVIRAYYDPLQDPAAVRALAQGALSYVGYLQFMRLSFRGMPIPPDVYGGRLADRLPYVYGDDQRFVDFMSPSEAYLRGIYTPFYPYNALLVNDTATQNSDFFHHPLENGSLRSPGDLGDTQSMAASLFGEIAPGLATPADVKNCLTDDNMILVFSPSPAELSQSEPYRLALNRLKAQPLPSAPFGGAPLNGLDESGIAAQVIGDYVLLTLPDPEDLGATLVVRTRVPPGGGTEVVVHLISDYDMAAMVSDAGRAALWRIREYQIDKGIVDSNDLPEAPSGGRGHSGLLTPPFRLSPNEYALELRYWTLAVAVRGFGPGGRTSRHTLSGLTWSALFQFDEDTGSVTFAAIRRPKLIGAYALTAGLRAFSRARDSAFTRAQHIDTSNFTKAAMRRENFAAGNKLQFVDDSGAVLT